MRWALVMVVLGSACLGGGYFHVVRPKLATVKKVALVQYAINPRLLSGTAVVEDTRWGVAARNTELFAVEMGELWQVMPRPAMLQHAAYGGAGKPSLDGWLTGKGMRFFNDDPSDYFPQTASAPLRAVCQGLGVDAVATVTESWTLGRATVRSNPPLGAGFAINLFSCDGTRIWSDGTFAESSDTLWAPAGIPAVESARWVAADAQCFGTALAEVKRRLLAPPPAR